MCSMHVLAEKELVFKTLEGSSNAVMTGKGSWARGEHHES